MTLEKPPTTLGENQFKSSFLFLKMLFTVRNIQQKNIKKTFTTYLVFCASQPTRKLATSKTKQKYCYTASSKSIIRPRQNSCTASLKPLYDLLQICCTASSKSVVWPPWKSCPNITFCCVLTQLYGFAKVLLWNVCQATAYFSSLSRNLPFSLALLLSICSWKNEWHFPPFPSLI